MSGTSKPHPRNAVKHSRRQMGPIAAGIAVLASSVKRSEARPSLCVSQRLVPIREPEVTA
jgi:fructose-bisphosphate aldolase class 1